MAAIIHSPDTLGEIVDDLKEICGRLEKVRKKMADEKVKEIGIDGEKGQVNGRTALHAFASNAEERLRRAIADRYLDKIEK